MDLPQNIEKTALMRGVFLVHRTGYNLMISHLFSFVKRFSHFFSYLAACTNLWGDFLCSGICFLTYVQPLENHLMRWQRK